MSDRFSTAVQLLILKLWKKRRFQQITMSTSGPSHNIKAPKPGERIKKNGFIHGIGRAFTHTANFIGFPVGDDHDVDASLSSNLQNEENLQKIKQIEASQEAAADAAKAKQTSESTTSSQQ